MLLAISEAATPSLGTARGAGSDTLLCYMTGPASGNFASRSSPQWRVASENKPAKTFFIIFIRIYVCRTNKFPLYLNFPFKVTTKFRLLHIVMQDKI